MELELIVLKKKEEVTLITLSKKVAIQQISEGYRKIEKIIDHYEPDIKNVSDNIIDLALEREKKKSYEFWNNNA